jgi:hypothetical protein
LQGEPRKPKETSLSTLVSIRTRRINSRLEKHEVHLRGLALESAQADFVLLQVQF